jgi:hypothetical protein
MTVRLLGRELSAIEVLTLVIFLGVTVGYFYIFRQGYSDILSIGVLVIAYGLILMGHFLITTKAEINKYHIE